MNDTSPEVERMVRERYAAMESVQRLLIGVSMFESARAMALASHRAFRHWTCAGNFASACIRGLPPAHTARRKAMRNDKDRVEPNLESARAALDAPNSPLDRQGASAELERLAGQ